MKNWNVGQNRHDIATRRQFLQIGSSGLLGLNLPGLLAGRQATAADVPVGRAKSVIVILLSGGLGQHDSFDMKPDAPMESGASSSRSIQMYLA